MVQRTGGNESFQFLRRRTEGAEALADGGNGQAVVLFDLDHQLGGVPRVVADGAQAAVA